MEANRGAQGSSKDRRQVRDKGPLAWQKQSPDNPSASSHAIPAQGGSFAQTVHLTSLESGRERGGESQAERTWLLAGLGAPKGIQEAPTS